MTNLFSVQSALWLNWIESHLELGGFFVVVVYASAVMNNHVDEVLLPSPEGPLTDRMIAVRPMPLFRVREGSLVNQEATRPCTTRLADKTEQHRRAAPAAPRMVSLRRAKPGGEGS